MNNEEDWMNWPEPPKTGVVVVWTNENGKLRMATHAGDWWYLIAGSYVRTWPELLAFINTDSDGTPPRIVPLNEPEPEPEPERVVVWKTGDPIDKLKPYTDKEGVEVRAERDGVVVVGPLKRPYLGTVVVGALTLTESRWNIAVTAPKPLAPWWLVDRIEPGHVVSWTDNGSDSEPSEPSESCAIVWWGTRDFAEWRTHWDKEADPTTWRVTDVHAAGGPKLIAGAS